MKRSERKIYCKCIAIMAVYIISAVYFFTLPSQAHTAQIAENVPYLDETVSDEEFTAEPSETPEMGQIREMSAMPCEAPEAFERWLETYEQETSEEVASERTESTERIDAECVPVQQTEEVQMETATKTYAVGESVLNPDLQAYLYQRLSDYQLEWFMPYAVMIAYQESKFNIYAENPNGLDKGLFQFRLPYYPGQDIFNPYEQIDIFCQQMANRSQYDVYEMISRHNVSDWGSYNATYVSQVLAHEANLREVN